MTDDDRLELGSPGRSGFLRRTVRIEAKASRPYRASEWQDCLVVVESGEVDLVATSGARHTCRGGDILWLTGLPLRCLSNQGDRPVVITAVRRRDRAGWAGGFGPVCEPGRMSDASHPPTEPTAGALRRWRRRLADERAEGAIYRRLARRRSGDERDILLGLAEAEARHARHWENLLGPDAGPPRPARLRMRLLAWLAGRFGSVFVLALVYRARAMPEDQAHRLADDQIRRRSIRPAHHDAGVDGHDVVGTAMKAAVSSFCFFAIGAAIPVLPYLFGLTGLSAMVVALVLVSLALILTGSIVGVLSGGPPLRRGLRQLVIGLGAAAVTYLLGLVFGATVG